MHIVHDVENSSLQFGRQDHCTMQFARVQKITKCMLQPHTCAEELANSLSTVDGIVSLTALSLASLRRSLSHTDLQNSG